MKTRLGMVLALAGAGVLASGQAVAGPSSGLMGLRASVGGSGISNGGGFSPAVGFVFFPSDAVALTFDVGFQISAGANQITTAGFGLGAGANFYLGARTSPVIPFITIGLGFGKLATNRADFALQFDAGGGVEYWVTDHFSLQALALLVVPISFPERAGLGVSVATVSPFLGASFYF